MTEPTRPAAARGERRATLSRELSDFLIELSIALHKHAMYPEGHPSLAPSSDAVAGRLAALLAERGTLSLGVARNQLIIEGVATDPRNPVLHDLADRLHRHHLGAVSFSTGVSGAEIEDALKVLAVEADRMDEPLGLRQADRIPVWPHVRLYPVTFDRLELVGGDEGEPGVAVSGGRAGQLWVGLARAALAAEETAKPGQAPPEPLAFRPEPLSDAEIETALTEAKAGEIEQDVADPGAVARAIEAHERGTAYDQVIVGYLLQIADELKNSGGAAGVALRKKMSKLITALDDRTLARLLAMGGDVNQRRQFLLDASQGMAVDAVVDLVRAASETGAPISNAMLRMLQKLGHHAERGPAPRRSIAESALREQVTELLKGWTLADPNPGGYGLALQRMAAMGPTLVAAEEAAYAPEPERIVRMALEAGAMGVPVQRAVEQMVSQGRTAELLELVQKAPQSNTAVEALRARLVDPELLARLLSEHPVDFALADQLISALGGRSVEPMLRVLAESESRQVRRAIIDRLLKQPEDLRRALTQWRGDERWYVVRNMLYLAAELPGPAAFDAAQYRAHDDARVRREALRVLFKQPDERTRAVCTALTDADSRVVRLALAALSEGSVPEPAVPLLANLATDEEQDPELRVPAVRALSAAGSRAALDVLLRLAEVKRRTFIGNLMAAGQASPVLLAAIAALGPHRSDARVRDRLVSITSGRDAAAAKAAAEALKGH